MPSESTSSPTPAARANWAGNIRYQSPRLEEPGNANELAKRIAASPKVKPLGTRHSFNQIADTDGIQLSLERLGRIGPLEARSRTVAVEAGVRFGELGRFLEARGFALRNLASLPHISVVGACATATHGSGVENGCLATEIAAMEMIDGRGERVRLSRHDDPETFPGAVVHLGALGVVTSLRLDLVPSYRIAQTVYENLPLEILETESEAIFSAAYSVSLFTDWRQRRFHQVWAKRRVAADTVNAPQETSFFGAPVATENLHPLPGHDPRHCSEQRGIPGAWSDRLPHFRLEFTPSSGEELQSEYMVARENAWPALSALFELRERIEPLIHVSEFRAVGADDLWLSPFYRRPSLTIHFTWKRRQTEVARLLPEIEAALAPFQPRPHWGKLFAMEPEDIGSLYPRFDDFWRLAKSFDPKGKLRNAFLERLLG